ncbi:DUF2125 domain-containing protein [Neptunicoccus sediminis]|uniref:DUF2125 domain-containing protein n=1 Tax=Neptunicoccus sediminis TaxID=1892596 RepID=UPI000846242C|nr:DUF2125 domain-containing protein [Neptunicoccus sediminis]
MSLSIKRFSSALLLSTALGAPVFAQELAQEVVGEYFDELRAGGMTVSPGAQKVSGSIVEWRDITVGLPQDEGHYTLDFMRAEELGGGKVSLSYPPEVKITIDPKGEQSQADIVVRTEGITHIVSGEKAARNHDITASRIAVAMTNMDPPFSMELAVNDVVVRQVSSGAQTLHYKGDMKAANLETQYDLFDGQTNISSTGSYDNLSASFDMDAVNEASLDELFAGTRNLSVSYQMGKMIGSTDIAAPQSAMVVQTSARSADGSFSVLDGIFDMGGTAQDVAYDVKLKDIPLLPFTAQMKALTTQMKLPLKKVVDPLPARLQMGFDGLELSDTVWGMFDPTGALPRDAAKLNIDLSAQIKWLVDALGAPQAESFPVEVDHVKINDVTLNIAGAALNGSGEAKLNNATFPPMPVGEVNMDLKGGVGLLDKLVALGLVPQQQGQMIKMMSGMFTVPGGDGTDHLVSKIKMNPDGSILANGQRIK